MAETLTPQEFVNKWRGTDLSERATYQMHFADVCRMVGYETPSGSGEDSNGNIFTFEYSLKKDSGGNGFADVYLQGHFAIEYKAPGKYKDLRAAYDQLLQYREQLQNPPLLVVTDIENWEIHTNWPNTEKRVYSFSNEDLATRPSLVELLRNLFYDPKKLHPNKNTEQVTADAAEAFRLIANNMRSWEAEPERIAHFLTKLVFCLFAEDVSLLPSGPGGEVGIFSEIIEKTRKEPQRFMRYTDELFQAMADGGEVMFARIPYFNGTLFDDVRVEDIQLEVLGQLANAARLNWESVEPAIFGTLFERSLDPEKRSQLGAHYTSREDILLIVNPVLMRPLEREWERIQQEAAPIREKYEEALQTSNRRNQTTYQRQLEALREEMLHQLRSVRVLDPACGSGNFLYVALQRLMDMEKEVIFHPLFMGLSQPFPEVHPRQMYGIEINPIAHALASIVVWIGYLQWRRINGYTAWSEPILEDLHENIACKDAILAYEDIPPLTPPASQGEDFPPLTPPASQGEDSFPSLNPSPLREEGLGFPLRSGGTEGGNQNTAKGTQGEDFPPLTPPASQGEDFPPLTPPASQGEDSFPSLNPSPLREEGLGFPLRSGGTEGGNQNTAKGTEGGSKKPTEPDWPEVDVIIGNPPFLGGQKFRRELGDEYAEAIWHLYGDRIAGGADLVTYWFERARKQIEQGKAKRAGLLATNSIRGGTNREVLQRIKASGDIFMAWADREWVLEGAAVRVSIVGFDDGTETERLLEDEPVPQINPDLTGSVDVTVAVDLPENKDLCFIGPQKDGPLDIENDLARTLLASSNSSGLNNRDVIRPFLNGSDIVRRSRNKWIIDFDDMTQEQAARYEAPFAYMEQTLKPIRATNRDRQRRDNWWRLGRHGSDYREAKKLISRQIFTPRVAKHRVFIWVAEEFWPDSAVSVIARDDDYFFGVLHSKLHEVWSLRMGTSLEDRPRYTPTTTFETFPFPWSPGAEDTSHPAYAAISAAAKQLHEERDAWLNPVPSFPLRSGGTEGGSENIPSLNPSPLREEGLGFPSRSGGTEGGIQDAGTEGGIPTRTSAELWEKLKPFVRDLRKNQTAAEDMLWQRLRRKQLHDVRWRRQQPVGNYIADFYCPAAKLVVEVDGLSHEQQEEYDAIRTEYMESLGLRVIRFTNGEVMQHLDAVIERIGEEMLQSLPSRSGGTEGGSENIPSLNPSPLREEGLDAAGGRENIPSLNPSPLREEGLGFPLRSGGTEGGISPSELKNRTLTNLYNALVEYREMGDKMRDKPKNIKAAAWDFAPRLAELHDALDKAVCDAYGWPHEILGDEEEILRRLLALNLERAAAQEET